MSDSDDEEDKVKVEQKKKISREREGWGGGGGGGNVPIGRGRGGLAEMSQMRDQVGTREVPRRDQGGETALMGLCWATIMCPFHSATSLLLGSGGEAAKRKDPGD
jgi:hypothetical protein